jgi:hypothetical protein
VAAVLSFSGMREDGSAWVCTEIVASAAGATPWGRGADAVATDVGNTRNTPAEVLEARTPMRLERVAVRRGSGGRARTAAGTASAAPGASSKVAASVSYRGERHRTAAPGAAGGGPGACGSARLRAPRRPRGAPARQGPRGLEGTATSSSSKPQARADGGRPCRTHTPPGARHDRPCITPNLQPEPARADRGRRRRAGRALSPANAEATWPARPVRIVVPFSPGAAPTCWRGASASASAAALGQPVVVDNRPGAGGATGADHVAKSAPDGYTLLMGVTGSQAISASLNPKLPYDPCATSRPSRRW